MKIPGVIGGLGPQTTADYYLRVQELAHEHESAARPPMLTWSVPLPYELEERSIFEGTGFDEIGDYLVEGAQRLEKAGADFVVMPCNTLHLLGKRIRDSIDIPFVSIIDETVKAVQEKGIGRVALLATGPTANEGLYDTPLEDAGIEVVKPTDEQQSSLNAMVVRLINGQQTAEDRGEFQGVLDDLKGRGAEAALLACTDFHILHDENADMEAIDTMEVLAQATMREMLVDDN